MVESPDPAGAPREDPQEPQTPELQEALRAAVARSGFGHVAPGEAPTGPALLAAMGGVRGIVESVLPGVVFLVVFTITHQTAPSVIAPAALSVLFIVARLVQRQPIGPAVSGAVLIAVSAALALWTGNTADNFLLGFVVNGVFAAVLLVSLLARWPLVGVVVQLLTGGDLSDSSWRREAAKSRVATIATIVLLAVFVIRLAIELPLYAAGAAGALGVTKLALGLPLYALALWIAWLLVRTAWTRERGEAADDSGTR